MLAWGEEGTKLCGRWAAESILVFKVRDYIREMVDVGADRECTGLNWADGLNGALRLN